MQTAEIADTVMVAQHVAACAGYADSDAQHRAVCRAYL